MMRITFIFVAAYLWSIVAVPGAMGAAATQPVHREAMFPLIGEEPQDIRDLVRLLYALSLPAVESAEERTLQYNKFAPEATSAAVLRDTMIPKDLSGILAKKREWWPRFVSGKFIEAGGPDAVVGRFQSGGYIVQVAESRQQYVLIARKEKGPLDLSASQLLGGLPNSYAEVLRANVFTEQKLTSKRSVKLSNGNILNWWTVSVPSLPENIEGGPFLADAIWTDDVLVLRLAKRWANIATPGPMQSRPLFNAADQRDTAHPRSNELETLAKNGAGSMIQLDWRLIALAVLVLCGGVVAVLSLLRRRQSVE